MSTVAPLPLGRAIEVLRSPFVLEEASSAAGCPLFAVDLDASVHPDPADLARAVEVLRALACVTVGVTRTEAPEEAHRRLAGAFDVLTENDEQLAMAGAAVVAHPLAALALVHVLRAGEGLGVTESLVLESLAYSMLQAGPEHRAWLDARPGRRPREPERPPVRSERRGGTLVVTLDRGEVHNAYSAAMRDGVVEALQTAAGDPSVEEVVLRGAGPSFCSGGDLAEFGTAPDNATAHAVRSARNAGWWVQRCRDRGIRVRAELHGACIGAGIELAAFASEVVAAPGTEIRLPELAMGLVPGAGGTVSLPRRIGRQRTAWLALTGAPLDAGTALRWGLADEIREVPCT